LFSRGTVPNSSTLFLREVFVFKYAFKNNNS
jgi:hypothetical protein